MKAILISIKPRHCTNIAKGIKKIEVRKSNPKLKTPFKCYIYMTKSEDGCYSDWEYPKRQKVIGEYICDYITTDFLISDTCISVEDLEMYSGNKAIYGWHISNLKIYDEPKELSEFKKINRDCWYADLGLAKRDCPECDNKACFIQRPPQSWCYVEKINV